MEENDKEVIEKKVIEEKFSEKEKKEKRKSLISIIKHCPKFIKRGIMLLLAIGIFILGVKYSSVFTTKTEALGIEFKNVGELVTQSAYVKVLKDSAFNRKLFEKFDIPFTESRMLFTYNIQVDASINFEEISIKSIDEENKKIIITLPHSKIYNSTLDLNSFKKYIDSESWFSRIDSEKYNETLKDVKKEGEQDAIDNGLLTKADENGKILIESFIKSNEKYKDYNIEYQYIEEGINNEETPQ